MHDSALESVLSNPTLPSLPAVAIEVLELTSRLDVDLREIERTIECDQAIAAKVLRTVNSSYYGLPNKCGNIRQAVAFLGLETIKGLVLGFSLVRVADGGGDDEVSFDFIDYWRRSFLCASLAREFARTVKGVNPEEAFIAGLVQDVGMVALWRVHGDRYLQMIDMTNGDHERMTSIERRILDIDHASVGAEMTRRWRFPDSIVSAIEVHENALACMSVADKFARVVRIAGIAARAITIDAAEARSVMVTLRNHAWDWFQMTPDQVRKNIESGTESAGRIASMLDMDAGGMPEVDEILARADEVRAGLPQPCVPDFEEDKAEIDETTGLPQRSRLLTDLETFYSANSDREPIALLLLGVDEVRSLNEEFGDSGGDAALTHVAECVREVLGFCRGRVSAYRFVGAEIAVTLEGLDDLDAMNLAEEIRSTIACRPVRITTRTGASDFSSIHVTIGMGTHHPGEGQMVTSSPDGLLRASMCAVTAGRRLGGDRVHVYSDEQVHGSTTAEVA